LFTKEGFAMNNYDTAKQNTFFMFGQGFWSFGFFGLKTTEGCNVQSV
jgi:hypothetical protein